jgi:glycosyltransferase involved in cell wall biosynthesis
MARTLTMITPVYQPLAEHLIAAHESVTSQEMPEGWDWEWILQEDGNTEVARSILPSGDPRLIFATGRHGGVAITRNLALARARGELVKNLDQDDVLAPGVLARDINVLVADPSVGWTTTRVLDLMPDGSTVGFDNDPPPGLIAPGFVLRHWIEHNYRLPVHPTSICIRRDLAVALGGWMAVPGSDDTGLLTAASVVSTGYFHPEVGLLYRKWPGQATADPAHTEPVEWQLRMGLIRARAELLAKTWPALG